MTGRWRLHRAGMLNVYQYGDETIEFGGGRLLLRGVNGSGKSTAMNMLLPFLIEADTRRIDAAGEQSGVLRSWMLSGRDEPNPVGYLWIEFARPNPDTGEIEYLTCGCGIRASASTERVTTWWFVTDRRPGVDFSLLDRRTPLSIDPLRAEIGKHAVFTHDRRADYRTEVRARLFGGAELDRHLRLLHIVRSPRVGDRIDVDLPAYLDGALPQLSDAALADAAQPLEDLDEHRNNVAALTRTLDALNGLSAVYQSYARRELRSSAAHADELHREVRVARRFEAEQRRVAAALQEQLVAAERAIEQLETADGRLDAELRAMRDLPAYHAGAELVDLRSLVESLERQVVDTTSECEQLGRRRGESVRTVVQQEARYEHTSVTLREALEEIAAVVGALRLDTLPPFPGVERTTTSDPGYGDVVLAKHFIVDTVPLRSALTHTVLQSELRRTEIAEIVAMHEIVERLERSLRGEEAQQKRCSEEVAAAEETLHAALEARRHEESTWRSDTHAWITALAELDVDAVATPGADLDRVVDGPIGDGALASIAVALQDAVLRVAHHHGRQDAELGVMLTQQQTELDRCRMVRDGLAATTLPIPPALGWQRESRRRAFADLIDFAPHADDDARRGIEAAMEAAGLLGAELVGPDVALATGELVVTPRHPVANPLSVFVVALDHDQIVGPILAGISTDLAGEAETVITVDGHFRTGALRGRHQKTQVEHIGVAARRAALERRRAEAAAAVVQAEDDVEKTELARERQRQLIFAADEHRRALPSTQPVEAAAARCDARHDHHLRALAALDRAAAAAQRAEVEYAGSVAEVRRACATRHLPLDRKELTLADDTLVTLKASCRSAPATIASVESALREWSAAADLWRRSADDHVGRLEQLLRRTAERDEKLTRLATLEDTVGTAWAEVSTMIVTSEHEQTQVRTALKAARNNAMTATAETTRSREAAHAAAGELVAKEQRCAATVDVLTAVLGVSGLVASAVAGADATPGAVPVWPTVAKSADGARELAVAIQQAVAEPERGDVGADNVRHSLRQRRDQLGAGWDAEDQQPNPGLPIAVEVTGPLGRMPLADASVEVASQLRSQSGLLTAKQDQALRNLLQGVVAREVAEKLFAAEELVKLMNKRLSTVTTAHGIGASLRWRRRDGLDDELAGVIGLLAKSPDLRTVDEDAQLAGALSVRIDTARRDDPDATYRDLIARVLDYRSWHEMSVLVHRPGENPRALARHPKLSEGEKKIVSYLPLFAAVAASCDALAESAPDAPRFLLLDDAFAKVSEDNHGSLFGLLVDLDLDFIATSERLWGTHSSVPELAICEVVRDAQTSTILLEHARWDGKAVERSVAAR